MLALKKKVLLAAVALFALFAWSSARFLLRQEHRQITHEAAQGIAAMQEVDAAQAREQLLLAKKRTLFFAQTPAIAGIGRALDNGGLDPLDGYSLDLWRARLEQMAQAWMASFPEVHQARLIGVANGGRELVSVVRDPNGTVTVIAPADLQPMGDRPYFTAAVGLPEGAVYLSPVELNQEQGRIEQPPRPTVRAAVPVRHARGEVFGVVVLNTLAQPLLDFVTTHNLPAVQEWVTDAAGHFLSHPQPGKAFAHELTPPGTTWSAEFPATPAGDTLAAIAGLPEGVAQATVRGPDGADWLMFTHTLGAAESGGAGALVLHSGVPLKALAAWAWDSARDEILLVWLLGLAVLGLLTFMVLRWRGTPLGLALEEQPGAPGRTLRVFGLELPLTSTGRRPRSQVVAAALLPVVMWGGLSLLRGQNEPFWFIFMLLPVLLASWWGGLSAGLAATVLAALGAWDLATPGTPPLDISGGKPMDMVATGVLALCGVLATFIQETIRRRGALLVSTMRAAQQKASQATLILNRASDLIQSVAPDGRILFCNAAWEETLGYTAADRKNLNIFDIVAPDCAEHCGLTFRRLMSGEDVGLVTVVFLAKNGKTVELEGHVSVAFEEGRPTSTLGVFRDVTERNAQHRRIEKQNNLQDDLRLVQADFINKSSASDAFERLLAVLLKFTQSEYGFIGEVLSQTNGQPYLKTHALTNIAWNEETRRLYDEQAAKGMEFHNLKTLFGAVMVDGRPVIANDPGTDPRRGGLPPGHPPMNAFLGLPIKHGDDLIGMIGVANRPGGYSEEMIGELAPLLSLYASLIVARKSKQEQEKTLMALQQSETKFRNLWELSQEAHVLCFPPDWKLTGGNQAAVRLFGARDSDHLATITPAELSPERQPDGEPSSTKVARLIEEALREGTSCFEWMHRRSDDGTEWPAEVRLGRFFFNGRTGVQATVRNIQDQKKIEQLTRENAERYQAMADSASSAIISVDDQGKIMSWNKGAAGVFGFTAAEAIGKPMSIIIPERYREAHAAGMRRVASGGPSRVIGKTVELQALRKNGTEFEMELSLSSWSQGGRVFFSGIIQDITARKSAERLLADFKAALDEHAIVAITDSRGRITYVNHRFCKISKYSQEELLGQDHRIINSGHHAKEFFANLWKTITSGQVWQGEIKNRAKDGSYYWVETSIVPFIGENGKPSQFIALRNDITALKAAEEKILVFNKNLEELVTQRTREMQMALTTLDASTDGAFIFDPKTLRFSYVNRGAENLTGYSREELLAMTFLDLGTEYTEPKLREHLATVVSSEMSGTQMSTSYRRKDGKSVPVEINLKYVAPPGEEPRFIAMGRDITERIKQERLFQRTQRLESLGTLASGIAHDLNNALAPIIMGGDLLRLKPEDPATLETIQNSGKRAAEMVRQLLTFAKGQEGKKTPLKADTLVREVEMIIKSTFPKNISLRINLEENLPRIVGDATQLHQVLLNLCVNARDAMPRGGQIKITVRKKTIDEVFLAASHAELKPGRYLLLEVEDNGTGIPPDVLDRMFEPFFTTKSLDKGTGLGLANVLGILKGHGGGIVVYTEQGKGSKFSVYLPIESLDKGTSFVPKKQLNVVGSGQTILLVDDEAPIRDIGAAILSKMGFKVITASDGMEALILATKHQTELNAVLTDMDMPHMNGISLIQMLRRMSDDLPVAVMSGQFAENTLEDLKEYGILQKLYKPFTENDLKQVLQNLLFS